MVDALLRVDDLRVRYGGIEAVKGISLEVGLGEVVTLIGGNGAGKTTTLKTISGVKRPTAGSVTFRGERIDGLAAHEIVDVGICQAPEGRRIFPRMSVRENLLMGAYGRRDGAGIQEDLDRVWSLFPVLEERAAQAGGTLSGGEQQMLAIGRALMAQPKLLLLDEPSLGLAPRAARSIFDAIPRFRNEGLTVLLVEQNARAALQIADRAYVLETGRVAMEGSAEEMLNQREVQRAYLGRGSQQVWDDA